MAKGRRPFGFGGSKRTKRGSDQKVRRGFPFRGKNNTGKPTSKKKNNLYTKGGEFTLDGTNYIGDYHIMEDGRPMTGKEHKGKGLFGLRRRSKRSKYLEPVTTPSDTTPADTTPTPPIDTTPPPPPPPPKIPPRPPKVDLSGIINQPYKPLANYGNQYPATNSSVKDAANTNITSYYGGGKVNGHLGNSQVVRGPLDVLGAQTRSELNIDFVLNLDGSLYTSAQMNAKINQAKAESNFYYIQSVPVINVSTSQIPPYGSSLFTAEEEYAFNVPTNQIDNISEVLKTIDWTCRKQAQLEQPRPYSDRYDSKEAVASRLNIDDVIASANKPPKIRWRQAT